MNGEWLQEFDKKLDGSIPEVERSNRIKISVVNGSNFIARYTTNNPNTYQGKIYTARTTSIINMVFSSRDYYGVWTGKMISAREIVGTWFDVAGQSGDFKLTRLD